MEKKIRKSSGTIIRKGSWSDTFVIRNPEREEIFRKILHHGNIDTTQREVIAANIAWNAGIPTPKPLNIGFSSDDGKYYADFQYMPLQKITVLDKNISSQISKIIKGFKSIKIDKRILKYSWKTNLEEHLRAFDILLKNSHLGSDNLFMLNFIRTEILKTPPMNFVHGDFGIHNIGMTDCNRVVCFDFQSACNGPDEWDIGYFAGCLNPFKLEQFQKYITPRSIRYALFVAGVKIGRKMLRGNNFKKSDQNLLDWLVYAKKERLVRG